jgi:aspartyl-tRNA(Asn)/glutamyl-tRNA(Gln) amidotransferase subunit A
VLDIVANDEDTIAGVGRLLRDRRRTCVEVLEGCLARIDEWETRVHAWVVVDREGAMAQARARDAELAAGRSRGPLHGIPIGIKDIIDVAGLPTACGSKLRAERSRPRTPGSSPRSAGRVR